MLALSMLLIILRALEVVEVYLLFVDASNDGKHDALVGEQRDGHIIA